MKVEIEKDYLMNGSVSLLILNWNNASMTMECVDSVIETTPPGVEIVVIDNGSRESELATLRKFATKRPFKLLEVGVNRFYGEGNNLGAEYASGEILVFLNNDVLFKSNWLEPLVNRLTTMPNVGAVGPQFIYPNGLLQEAGALVGPNGESVQIGKFQNPDQRRFLTPRYVDYVSAATVAVRKSDFLKVGGFNFIYEPAYYEDTELCFALSQIGLKTLYEPASRVIHRESVTTSDATNGLNLNNISEINRVKFVRRWLSNEEKPKPPLGLGSRATAVDSSKTVGVFTPFSISIGGGEKYVLSIVAFFLREGFRVTLITDFSYSRLRVAAVSETMKLDLAGVELASIQSCQGRTFDMFISMGNELFPPVKPLGRVNIHHCQFPFPHNRGATEVAARLKSTDAVVVNSHFTRDHYLQSAQKYKLEVDNVKVIYPPVQVAPVSKTSQDRNSIVNIGRFFVGGHSKRQDVLIEAFREVHKQNPKAKLTLIGGLLPGSEHRHYLWHCMHLAKDLPVTFLIDASSKDVDEVLSKSAVYWHGAGFDVDPETRPEQCEHFGMTVVEAMSRGLIPVVVGVGGPGEVVDHGVNGYKYFTISGLVRNTSFLFEMNSSRFKELRREALKKSEEFTRDQFASSWRELAKDLKF